MSGPNWALNIRPTSRLKIVSPASVMVRSPWYGEVRETTISYRSSKVDFHTICLFIDCLVSVWVLRRVRHRECGTRTACNGGWNVAMRWVECFREEARARGAMERARA